MVTKETTKTKKTATEQNLNIDSCQIILPKDLTKCNNVKITVEKKS